MHRKKKLFTCGLFWLSKLAGGVGRGLGFCAFGGRFLIGGPNRNDRSGGRLFSLSLGLLDFLRWLVLPPSEANLKSSARSKKSPPGGRGLLFFFCLESTKNIIRTKQTDILRNCSSFHYHRLFNTCFSSFLGGPPLSFLLFI